VEQPVPRGPLAVRWHALELETVRAGALSRARVVVENAGSAAWRSPSQVEGVKLSYHWLDERGNPIVWDGLRHELEAEPGAVLKLDVTVRGPIPPGRYRLAFDLVHEGRFWFAELGGVTCERPVDVEPRVRSWDELTAHLAPEVEPAPDWRERVLAAHAEGYAVVAGSVGTGRRGNKPLEPWAPGAGRVPRFPHPLLCPTAVAGVNIDWLDPVAGLPAAAPPADEPWLYDGRIELRLRRRSGRRFGGR
jgi:hypothetical protein